MGGEQTLRRCYNLYSCFCLAGSVMDPLCSAACAALGFVKQEIPRRSWSPGHGHGDWDRGRGLPTCRAGKLRLLGLLWMVCSVKGLSCELDPTVAPLRGSSAGLWAFFPRGFRVWEAALRLFFHSAPSCASGLSSAPPDTDSCSPCPPEHSPPVAAIPDPLCC